MNQQYIIYFISKTKKNMTQFIEKALSDKEMKGLIPSHGSILTNLYQSPIPLTMKQIAESIGKDKSTVTVLINQLINQGYVEKKQDLADRRVTLIALTPLGQSKEKEYREISKDVVETAYKDFTEEEKDQFLALLKRMNINFQNALKKP